MKAADQRMNLVDPGNLLAVPHNVDNPAMPATGNNHQPAFGQINQHALINHVIRFIAGHAVGFRAINGYLA